MKDLTTIKFTRQYAGMQTATLPDGREVELCNNRTIDGNEFSDDWLIRVDGDWFHTVELLRDAKTYIRFIATYGDTDGNDKFWAWL